MASSFLYRRDTRMADDGNPIAQMHLDISGSEHRHIVAFIERLRTAAPKTPFIRIGGRRRATTDLLWFPDTHREEAVSMLSLMDALNISGQTTNKHLNELMRLLRSWFVLKHVPREGWRELPAAPREGEIYRDRDKAIEINIENTPKGPLIRVTILNHSENREDRGVSYCLGAAEGVNFADTLDKKKKGVQEANDHRLSWNTTQWGGTISISHVNGLRVCSITGPWRMVWVVQMALRNTAWMIQRDEPQT